MSIDFYTVVLALAVILIIVIIWFVLHKKTAQSAESIIKSVLTEYQYDELRNFIIPDGIGGLIEIEHLVLLDKGLLVIERYPISGNLYGSENIDLWTQVLDGRSFKFSNPLRHIRISRQALKSLVPDIPIFCRVIFTADSIFPKGKPEEVSVIDSFDLDLMFLRQTPDVITKSKLAWEQVNLVARHNGQAVERGDIIDG